MKIKWLFWIGLTLLGAVLIDQEFDASSKQAPINIGILTVGDSRNEKVAGLKSGLKELGYKENEINFIVMNSKENPLVLNKQITDLLKMHPDLIVTLGGIETIELKKAMDKSKIKVPVVFAGVSSPREMGIIKEEKRPSGQFTGINNYHSSISGKRFEILHDLIPTIKRVHILYDDNTAISKLGLNKTIETATKLSITIKVWNVADDDFFKNIKNDIKKDDALFILPSFRIETMTEQLVQLSNSYRIPTMGIYEHEVKSGFLASYGTSFWDQGHQAARYVSLIIKGNDPGDLPVEMPDNIRFLVNKQEQDFLGLHLNQDLLKIAEFSGVNKKGNRE